ncbi:MAG TPA: hypothetical protein VK879_05625 [Candidatus Sulfomarinibacteraceae bacterium]|nr:hypothetical protein [Candidatus Sulfomarinibacteraceae bacterium]
MKEQLQEALLAVKAGEEERARVLLAELLREDPDNVPAWTLLSKLADSDVQKAAFLRKVLALEPGHAYAQQELSRMGALSPPQAVQAGEATALSEAEAADKPEAESPPPDFDQSLDAGQEGDEEQWAEEGEIVTADPPDDSLDWFLPEAQEEEAIESSLEELGRESAVSEDLFAGEPAAAESAGSEAASGSEVTDDAVDDEERDYDPSDYAAQEKSGTVPPWLPEEEVSAVQPEAEEQPEQETQAEAGAGLVEEGLPDWLQEEPEPDWLELEEDDEVRRQRQAQLAEEMRAAETEARLAAAMASGRGKPEEAPPTSPWLIGALALLAALVFLLAFYAAYTFMF